MKKKLIKTSLIWGFTLFFVSFVLLSHPFQAVLAVEKLKKSPINSTNTVKPAQEKLEETKSGFRIIPIYHLDENTLKVLIGNKEFKKYKVIQTSDNQRKNKHNAPLFLIVLGSEEETQRITEYIESVDQPISMLRLSVWRIQFSGEPDKVEEAVNTLSNELLCSRAQITGIFVYFRELIRNQKSISNTQKTYYVSKRIRRAAGRCGDFDKIQTQYYQSIISIILNNQDSKRINNATDVYKTKLYNYISDNRENEKVIKTGSNWIDSIEPVTLLDSFIMLNIASSTDREKVLEEFYANTSKIISNIEIEYVEKYENRSLCKVEKQRIREKNAKLHKFTKTRQFIKRHFEEKGDRQYPLHENDYLSQQDNIERLLDYRLRLYCAKELEKILSIRKKEAETNGDDEQKKALETALYQLKNMKKNYHKTVTLCESRLGTGLREFLLALDDDIRSQFIEPAIKKVRKGVRGKNIEISSIQRSTIMATSRTRAKISPRATAYFKIPKPEMSLIHLKKLSKYFSGATLGNILLSLQEDQDKIVERIITKKSWDQSCECLADQNGAKIELEINEEPIRFKLSKEKGLYTPVNIDSSPIPGIQLAYTLTKDNKTENLTSLVVFKKTENSFLKPKVTIGEEVEIKINNYGNEFKLAVENKTGGTLSNLKLIQGSGTTVGLCLAGKDEIEVISEKKLEDPFDHNIYKVQSGLDLEMAPIVLADGESALMRFNDLNFKFKPEVIEKDSYISTIDKNSITTQVTARTFEILELGNFESQTSITRDGNGIVPLYYVGEIIPIIRKIPLVGELFGTPKINKTKLQRSVVFVNPMIFPTVNDLLDYKTIPNK